MKKIAFLLVVLLITSCDKNDDYNETDIDLVTGIVLKNDIGDAVGDYGNPNIFIEEELVCYPNPLTNVLNVESLNNDRTISKIWIIKGNAQVIYQDSDFESILNSDLYTEHEINTIELYNSEPNSYNISIDISAYEVGYYRVFVKFDNGNLYWDNIYKGDESTTISDFEEFWNQ